MRARGRGCNDPRRLCRALRAAGIELLAAELLDGTSFPDARAIGGIGQEAGTRLRHEAEDDLRRLARAPLHIVAKAQELHLDSDRLQTLLVRLRSAGAAPPGDVR
jgi:hypothetical protein